MAAKSEEMRLAGLQKQYQSWGPANPSSEQAVRSNPDVKPKKCWNIDLTGHIIRPKPEEQSTGKSNLKSSARMLIRLNLLSLNA